MRSHLCESRGEESASAITHLLGLAGSAAALPIMLGATGGDPWKLVSAAVFGVTLVLLYASSTLYHTFGAPRIKALFQILDHACIYLLIAGTYNHAVWHLFVLAGSACHVVAVVRYILN